MYAVVSIIFFIVSFFLLWGGFMMKVNSFEYLVDYSLMSVGGVDMSYESLLDWVSMMFMGVVLLISSSVMIFSKDYMGGDKSENRFILLIVLFVSSMLLSVSSGGVLSMSLGWDGLGVVSYILVIYYQSSGSYKSGLITIMTNRLGDVLIILGIGLMLMSGVWSYQMVEGKVGILLVIAACTKSAQIPFSAWLPEAMAAPTPVSSLVHSSTLVTAGVFMLIRLEEVIKGSLILSGLLMYMSVMTMIMAGGSAMMEMDGKKIVASSTLSQLGLMMFSLSNGLWMLTYFHSIMHAFFKALMFMGVGSILWIEGGSQDIRFMSCKFKYSWLVNQGLFVSILCLIGFPFFCGFFSKDLSLEVYLSTEGAVISKMGFLLGFSFSVLYGSRLFMKMSVMVGEEKVYGGLGEGKNINLGVFVLSMVSLLGGALYSWLEDLGEVIVLSVGDKMISVLMMMVGIMFMFSWGSIFKGMKKSGDSGWEVFVGGSWNLSVLTGLLSMKLLKYEENYSDEDQGWVEEVGGGGVYLWNMVFMMMYSLKLVSFFLLMLLILLVVFVMI